MHNRSAFEGPDVYLLLRQSVARSANVFDGPSPNMQLILTQKISESLTDVCESFARFLSNRRRFLTGCCYQINTFLCYIEAHVYTKKKVPWWCTRLHLGLEVILQITTTLKLVTQKIYLLPFSSLLWLCCDFEGIIMWAMLQLDTWKVIGVTESIQGIQDRMQKQSHDGVLRNLLSKD